MKKLQIALSRKEKLERLICNLEKMKEEGTVDASQYEAMSQNYNQILNQTSSDIESMKGKTKQDVQTQQQALDAYKQELSNLEVRFKVGELSADFHIKESQKIQAKIQKCEEKLADFNKWLAAKSSQELGGYVDVPLEKKTAEFQISDISGSAGTLLSKALEFAGPLEVGSEKSRVLAWVGAALMFLSVFLPFMSIPLLGSQSLAGEFEGIMVLFVALIAAGVSFLERAKLRSIGLIACGGIGLLIAIYILIVAIKAEVASALAIGFYGLIVGSVVLLVGGLMGLKET